MARLTMSLVTVGALLPALAAGQVVQRYVGFTDVPEMPIPRSDMTAVPYNADVGDDARIYIMGGCTQDQTCVNGSCYCGEVTNNTLYFLPGQNRYVTSNADMPQPRYRHAAAELNGVIYLFGGRMLNDTLITTIDAYNIENNAWSTPCTWTNAASDNTAFVQDGRIFLTGGYPADYSSTIATLTEFNPTGCVFTPRTAMPSGRGDVSSTTVGGLSFVIGGFSSTFCGSDTTVEAYNATSDSWSTLANMRLGRADAAVGSINGQVFAIAGETVNAGCTRAVPVSDVERLAPGSGGDFSGQWQVARSVPANRFRFVGATVGSAIYLFGGQGDYVPNLGGAEGGFPVHRSVMKYAPYTYTPAEVTILLDAHDDNVTELHARITALESLTTTQATTITQLRSDVATLQSRFSGIDSRCYTAPATSQSGRRDRRTDQLASSGCPVASEASSSSSGALSTTLVVVIVVVGVAVVAAVAVIAVVVVRRTPTTAPPAEGKQVVMNVAYEEGVEVDDGMQ